MMNINNKSLNKNNINNIVDAIVIIIERCFT